MNQHVDRRTTLSTASAIVTALYPEEADPVVQIGRQLGDAYREDEANQIAEAAARRAKDGSRECYAKNRQSHSWDCVEALRAMLSHRQATTLEGAAIQIAGATTIVDMIWDQFPEENETYQIKQDFRALVRLLYSALTAIDAVLLRKVDDLVCKDFGGQNYMSPFVSVDAAQDYLQGKIKERTSSNGSDD